MAVSAFSEDGNYYSSISKDGRLRIWDTETNVLKQEYTPDLHLTSPPSCLQWITVANSSGAPQKSGKRKQSISEQESQCIVLGTKSGKLLIYSVTQAKIENVITDKDNEGHNNIAALDWHRKYGLYSCNKAGFVFEWDLQSGTVRNKYNVSVDSQNKQSSSVSAIKIVPHTQKTPARFLVTASWQVSIWRLHDGDASIVRHLGHNMAAGVLLNLVCLNNSCWLVEGSQNERLLSFWDVTVTEDHLPQVNGDDTTPRKKQRKKSTSGPATTPNYNFVLEDAPKFVDVRLRQEEGGNMLRLAAATRSGVVHYYGHMLNGASSKPIKPSVTVQVTSSDARPLPLFSCRLLSEDLLLGYSDGPTLLFERITPDLSSKTQVLIRGDSKPARKASRQTSEQQVNKVRSQPSDDAAYVEPLGGVARKRVQPGAQVEVPMEARLENLSLDTRSRSKSAVRQNLTKLLIQGLHSKDKSIILTVLQQDDPAVASSTVSQLPADHVPALLQQLADMASRKTSQCASVCTWLGAVLRCHSALLLATSGAAADHLTQLLALLTYRRSHLCQLLNLKGRLELTTAQRAARDGPPQDQQQAMLEYNDTSSESEMEVERYESDSERSWGDERDGALPADRDGTISDTDSDGD